MSAAFLALSLISLVAAAAAMLSRNLIHSALLLVLTWVGLAGLYLWAGADFVGFSQAIVYVGGVSMVVLFAVLLTRRHRGESEPPLAGAGWIRAAGGLAATLCVASVLTSAIVAAPRVVRSAAAPQVTVQRIGELLAGPHLVAVLIVGVILTVALIGALLIAAPMSAEDLPEPEALAPERTPRNPEDSP
ncbi:MAG: NADH-quinone oxidoreductase subunit J [Opitutaceae bacterium]